MSQNEELIVDLELLQNTLISVATGGPADNQIYKPLRRRLLASAVVCQLLPRIVQTHSDLNQFWQFIKNKYATYQERRDFIWGEFRPIIQGLESTSVNPSIDGIDESLRKLSSDSVHEAWKKALDKVSSDPSGAITASRSLLESVCKHILDDSKISYPPDIDLPKLYSLCANSLNISPSQHIEPIFKQILGGCASIVVGLGSLRNKIGDAHGQGRNPIKPARRHANLSANLAGSMATFLVETWEDRKT